MSNLRLFAIGGITGAAIATLMNQFFVAHVDPNLFRINLLLLGGCASVAIFGDKTRKSR